VRAATESPSGARCVIVPSGSPAERFSLAANGKADFRSRTGLLPARHRPEDRSRCAAKTHAARRSEERGIAPHRGGGDVPQTEITIRSVFMGLPFPIAAVAEEKAVKTSMVGGIGRVERLGPDEVEAVLAMAQFGAEGQGMEGPRPGEKGGIGHPGEAAYGSVIARRASPLPIGPAIVREENERKTLPASLPAQKRGPIRPRPLPPAGIPKALPPQPIDYKATAKSSTKSGPAGTPRARL
jgi:hypothetical protein